MTSSAPILRIPQETHERAWLEGRDAEELYDHADNWTWDGGPTIRPGPGAKLAAEVRADLAEDSGIVEVTQGRIHLASPRESTRGEVDEYGNFRDVIEPGIEIRRLNEDSFP